MHYDTPTIDPQHISSSEATWEAYLGAGLSHQTVKDAVNNDREKAIIAHYAFFTRSSNAAKTLGAAYIGTICALIPQGLFTLCWPTSEPFLVSISVQFCPTDDLNNN